MKNFLFTLLTFLLLLGLLEGGMRAWTWVSGDLPPHHNESLVDEWEFVQRYLGTGVHSFGEETPTVFDPDLGWRLRPGFRSEEVNINSLGQRGLAEFPKERNPGRRRILFVGDSYTFGFQSDDDHTFPALLGTKHLPEAEILNQGVPGYGIDQAILNYEKYGVEFAPHIVVLGFYSRDLNRNLRSFRGFTKPRFEIRQGQLELAPDRILSPTELLELYEKGERSIEPPGLFTVEALLKGVAKLADRRLSADSPSWKLSEKILERFIERARNEGSIPFILIIPHKEILEGDNNKTADTGTLIETHAKETRTAHLDLGPVFREAAERNAGEIYDGHLTPYGNEVVADALYEAFEEQGLLKQREGEENPSEEVAPLSQRYADE